MIVFRVFAFLVAFALVALATSARAAGIAPNNGGSIMGRKPTGRAYEKGGNFYARILLGAAVPASIPMPACADMEQARARARILAAIAKDLLDAGHEALALGFLERAGARTGKALDDVVEAVGKLCRGEARAPVQRGAAKPLDVPTVRSLGERWTSGELARDYPDHVKAKRSADKDVYRFDRYVYPVVESIPIVDFTLDHAEAVMRLIPAERAPATRRQVAQLLHRLFAMAVFPLRIRTDNPLPKGFLPKVGKGKAKGFLYPDEDAKLLASPAVPLCWRVLYGFLDREGPRAGEAAALDLADVDLVRGTVNLDENKTDDPRTVALTPGVKMALRAWLALREKEAGAPLAVTAPLFVDDADKRIDASGHLAQRFRLHLVAAGVDRAELHRTTEKRQQIRAHDLRATFVTLALANGQTESQVADKTGHRSSTMIQLYRRAARQVARLGVGELAPLHLAIPELSGKGNPNEGPTGPTDTSATESAKIVANGSEGRRSRLAKSAIDPISSAPWRNGKRWGFKRRAGATGTLRSAESTGKAEARSDGSGRLAGPFANSQSHFADSQSDHGEAESAPAKAPSTPRAALIAAVEEGLRAAVAAGDEEGAEVAREALVRLGAGQGGGR